MIKRCRGERPPRTPERRSPWEESRLPRWPRVIHVQKSYPLVAQGEVLNQFSIFEYSCMWFLAITSNIINIPVHTFLHILSHFFPCTCHMFHCARVPPEKLLLPWTWCDFIWRKRFSYKDLTKFSDFISGKNIKVIWASVFIWVWIVVKVQFLSLRKLECIDSVVIISDY